MSAAEDLLSLDTPLDRVIHRPVASWIARGLRGTPLTPNQLTLLSLVPAMAAARFFMETSWRSALAGLTCFYAWAVMDHADGELARLKNLTSRFGRRLDDFCDVLSSNLILIGLFAGLVEYARWNRLIVWPLFLSGLALEKIAGLWHLRMKRRARQKALEKGVPDPEFVRSQKLSDRLTGRESFYVLIACVLAAYAGRGVLPVGVGAAVIGGCYLTAAYSAYEGFCLARKTR